MEAPDRRVYLTQGNIAEPPGMNNQARSTMARDSGECHCHHVTKLQGDMAIVKTQLAHMKASVGAKPFIPGLPKVPTATGGG